MAPVPYRGKQNHPALVKHVAEAIAEFRGMSYEEIAEITTNNFYNCFNLEFSHFSPGPFALRSVGSTRLEGLSRQLK